MTSVDRITCSDVITQKSFLESLGADARFEQLKDHIEDYKDLERIQQARNRIMEDMGSIYKVMAIAGDNIPFDEGFVLPTIEEEPASE